MSTQTTITYNNSLCKPYTGILEQPDTVSLFLKSGNDVHIFDENIINTINNVPLCNFFVTAERIYEATLTIFASIRGEKSDLWNAFKNLGRGIVQLIPFAGNAALYLYDKAKTNLYTHPQIKAALATENDSTMGIAFDGKIITTFSIEQFNSHLNRKNSGSNNKYEDPFKVLRYMWFSLLCKSQEENLPSTRYDIALKLANNIKHT